MTLSLRGFLSALSFTLTLLSFSPLSAQTERLKIVATTAMVADLVKQIGGERVDVQTLMGPGVDPHLYKATSADTARLQRAEVIFYNGLHLEGKMQELFERLTKNGRLVKALADALPEEKLLHAEGAHDPHIWFDVSLWAQCIPAVTETLSKADPAGKEIYAANAAKAATRLAELHSWALAKSAELPPARRILVTSHDAYEYFGRAYGFRVVGLQGISTATEAGLSDVTKLVDFVRAQNVPAIFVESSVSPAAIRRIAADAKVKIGGELFSDAMGSPGQIKNGYDLGTYDGMIRHNLTTIVEALR